MEQRQKFTIPMYYFKAYLNLYLSVQPQITINHRRFNSIDVAVSCFVTASDKLCKLVQASASWYKLVQTDPSWCKLTQVGANWLKLVQASASWCKLWQAGARCGKLWQARGSWCKLGHFDRTLQMFSVKINQNFNRFNQFFLYTKK